MCATVLDDGLEIVLRGQAEDPCGVRVIATDLFVVNRPTAVRHPLATPEVEWREPHAAPRPQIGCAAEVPGSRHEVLAYRIAGDLEIVQRLRRLVGPEAAAL